VTNSKIRSDRFSAVDRSAGGGVFFDCPTCAVRLRFLIHYDAKTAPGVAVDERGRGKATVPNAFPLPVGPLEAGGSCPGVTAACRDCYAAGLELRGPGFRNGAAANLANLHHLYGCGSRRGGVDRVAAALVAIVRQSSTLQRMDGVRRPCFRWHSSGDIFAAWYATAIRRAILETGEIEHWGYTRSLGFVRYLDELPTNARWLVSADRENLLAAGRVAARYGWPVALLADDETDAAALWARLVGSVPGAVAARPVLCPVVGKWDDGRGVSSFVVGPDGRRSSVRPGGPGVGACVACGVCLPGGPSRPVTFTVHGGRARGDSAGRLGAAVRVRLSRRDAVGVAS
jgi:hypothetical protein